MKKPGFNQWVLIFILAVAAVFRLWNIPGAPPAVSMDEASIGYNAYSVLKTGGDEFGSFPFPSQRGYDDWRRSTYLLMVVPFVALFGLVPMAIRLPSIFLSLVTVWATYEMVRLLFAKNREFSQYVSLISALLLAISPWHVYISRIGHESNAYLAFFVLGVLFFLKAVREYRHILLSLIFSAFSVLSYYAGQVLVPVMAPAAFLIYRKEMIGGIIKNRKIRIILVLLLLGMVPVIAAVFSPSAMLRFSGTSTFNPDAHFQEYRARDEKWRQAVQNGDPVGKILYHRRLFPVKVFADSYVSHFRPSWLFANSGGEPFKTPNMGFLYTWQFPFVAVSILALLFSGLIESRSRIFLLVWLGAAALPGSIATGAPHAMRTYTFAVVWQILTGVGIAFVLGKLGRYKNAGIGVLLLFMLAGAISFAGNYFVVFPREQSGSFHYAFSAMVPYVTANEKKYGKIVFSNERNLYQSYMVFLYHRRFDPALYRSLGGTSSAGYAEKHAFGKYEFRPIRKDEEFAPGVLYIGNVSDFPADTKPLAEFVNSNGTIAIVAVTVP